MSTNVEYTEQLAEDIVFPHFFIFRRYRDGEFVQYRVEPHEGYVFYDTTEENWRQDSPDSEPYLVTIYYTIAYLNPRFNFENFNFIAVPRSEVNENDILGAGNDHEVASTQPDTDPEPITE